MLCSFWGEHFCDDVTKFPVVCMLAVLVIASLRHRIFYAAHCDGSSCTNSWCSLLCYLITITDNVGMVSCS